MSIFYPLEGSTVVDQWSCSGLRNATFWRMTGRDGTMLYVITGILNTWLPTSLIWKHWCESVWCWNWKKGKGCDITIVWEMYLHKMTWLNKRHYLITRFISTLRSCVHINVNVHADLEHNNFFSVIFWRVKVRARFINGLTVFSILVIVLLSSVVVKTGKWHKKVRGACGISAISADSSLPSSPLCQLLHLFPRLPQRFYSQSQSFVFAGAKWLFSQLVREMLWCSKSLWGLQTMM